MASLPVSEQHQDSDINLQALAVALQHPAVAAHQRSICTLLQVNKAWRTAVQQSAAGLTDIYFSCSHLTTSACCTADDQLDKVASFAQWLVDYSHLIGTMSIEGAGSLSTIEALQQLVETSLQAAAACAVSQLKLRSFSSSVPVTATLLATLPAATLTSLVLRRFDSSNWFTPVGQLTSLRQISLIMGDRGSAPEIKDDCLQALGTVKQLTKLQLNGVALYSDLSLLPVQLQQLAIKYKWSAEDEVNHPGPEAQADLQHLTCLQELKLSAYRLAAGSSLPPNLQSLQVHACIPARAVAGISSLQQVTSVVLDSALHTDAISSQDLALFAQLSQLKEFSLSIRWGNDLVAIAQAWHNLPLRSLDIEVLDKQITYWELQLLMQLIGNATQLTRLQVSIAWIVQSAVEASGLAVCGHLQALQNLKSLSLSLGDPQDFSEDDAGELSALASLTSLELSTGEGGPFVDGSALSVLAQHLTNLQELSVNVDRHPENQHVSIMSALPHVGRLAMLEKLWLDDLPEADAKSGLQMLTRLSRLRELQGFDQAGRGALQAFWRSIQH